MAGAAKPWEKYGGGASTAAPNKPDGPWSKYTDTFVGDDDLSDFDPQGREIIADSDERAGLPIPGTISEAEAAGEVQTGVVPPNRRLGLSSSDTINPIPAVAALGDRMFTSIPIAGEHIKRGRDQLNANIYGGTPEEARADMDETVRQNPGPAAVGEALGKSSPYIAAAAAGGPFAAALGLEGGLLARIIWGTASNEAIKFGDNMSRGEQPMEALGNATRDSLIEAPFFALGTKSGRAATVAKAPKTQQLFDEGNNLYDTVRDSKLVIAQPNADTFIQSTTSKAMSGGLDETLTPGSVSVVKRLQGMAGRNMSIEDAMLVRKLASDAWTNAKAGSNDARLARGIVNDLDTFLEGAATKGPQGQPNMAVLSGDADLAKTKLTEANKVWSAASKARLLDESIELAVAEAERGTRSLESTLKSEFAKLDREIIKGNPERFTPEEIKLIQEVARGNGGRNFAAFLGKTLYPNGPVSAISTMAATGGAGLSAFMHSGDPILTTAAALGPMAVGATGRAIASRSAKNSADYASASIRNNALGTQYTGTLGAELPPVIKALPSVAGRTATTMTLEEYRQKTPA